MIYFDLSQIKNIAGSGSNKIRIFAQYVGILEEQKKGHKSYHNNIKNNMYQCCNQYTAINSFTLNNFPVYDHATNNYSYAGDTNIHCIHDKDTKLDDCFYIGLIFKTYKPFIISLGYNTGHDDQLHVYANEYWFKKLFFHNTNHAQGITNLEKGMICELWCIQSYKITDIKTGKYNNSDLEEFWEVALLNIVKDPKDIDYLIRENAGVTPINSILEKINKIR